MFSCICWNEHKFHRRQHDQRVSCGLLMAAAYMRWLSGHGCSGEGRPVAGPPGTGSSHPSHHNKVPLSPCAFPSRSQHSCLSSRNHNFNTALFRDWGARRVFLMPLFSSGRKGLSPGANQQACTSPTARGGGAGKPAAACSLSRRRWEGEGGRLWSRQ